MGAGPRPVRASKFVSLVELEIYVKSTNKKEPNLDKENG
jgi:hypothetical protein